MSIITASEFESYFNESILLELLSTHVWIIHLGDVCPVVNSSVKFLTTHVRIILLGSIITTYFAAHHIILHSLISHSFHNNEVSPVD